MDSSKKKSVVLALAGAIILAGGANVWAQDQGKKDFPFAEERRARIKARMEDRFEGIQTELGLSVEQQQKLKKHRESKWLKQKAFREKMRAKRQALSAELQKPDFDRERINALHNDIKKLMSEQADERLEGIIYVREILTPEQYAEFMKKKDGFKRSRWKREGQREFSGRDKMKDNSLRHGGEDMVGPEF